jgi:hypothetical protein
MTYEKLTNALQPCCADFAFMHEDTGGPLRDHWVCYRVSENGPVRQYAIAGLSSEGSGFYDYHAPPPEERGLDLYGIYRVHGSDKAAAHEQHYVVCLCDLSIDITGEHFGVLGPLDGRHPGAVLAESLRMLPVCVPRNFSNFYGLLNKKEILQIPLPGGSEVAKTGAVRFQNDWPGIFIRGDEALSGLAAPIRTLEDKVKDSGDKEIAAAIRMLGIYARVIEQNVKV